jgi:D-sedoheptulose 7-phosphate isomerase
MRTARKVGIVTAAMTGLRVGKQAEMADYCTRVPPEHTRRIQEAHILLDHILCEIVDDAV